MHSYMTDEQKMIRETAHRFLRGVDFLRRLRGLVDTNAGFDERAWQGFAVDMGFAGLMIPELHGGSGLGALEMALLLEETGAALCVMPFFETAVMAVQAILRAGTESEQAALLPPIAAGSVKAAFAGIAGRPTLDGRRLTGLSRFVAFGHTADLLIVATEDDSLLTLPAKIAGIEIERLTTLDRTRPLSHVRFDLEVPADAVLGAPGASRAAIGKTLDVAAGLLAAEQTGGAQFCLDSTVAYVKDRVQFGRPIGSFQAIKHTLADMAVLVESARSGARCAATAIDAGESNLSMACSVALAQSTDCYRHCAGEAIQLHGALGFTWEHHAHLYFKRARSSSTLLGSPEYHRERVARMILDDGSADEGATKLTADRLGDDAIERFRGEIAGWLERALHGPFEILRGDHNVIDNIGLRRSWERTLGDAGWGAIGWPKAYGGRSASIAERIVFAEEYARAQAPRRVGYPGIELLGPAILALGTEDQKRRFLPDIISGRTIWCQGYSEPGAGSDLAAVQCRATLEGNRYRINGRKIWTTLGPVADWCFTVVRTVPDSVGSRGLSVLLVPLDQPGIEVRPIREITGRALFAELLFDGAIAKAADCLGEDGDGWKVAMTILGFERGISALGQQMEFQNELNALIAAAKANGMARDPLIRQRLAKAQGDLPIMRHSALRMLAAPERGALTPAAYTYKLFWSHWHRDLGELALDVLGQDGECIDFSAGDIAPLTDMALMSRSDTIFAGASQIQRNIIAERALGLPKEIAVR